MSYLSDHNASVIANRNDDPPDEDYCDRDDCGLAEENATLNELNMKLLKEIKELREQFDDLSDNKRRRELLSTATAIYTSTWCECESANDAVMRACDILDEVDEMIRFENTTFTLAEKKTDEEVE